MPGLVDEERGTRVTLAAETDETEKAKHESKISDSDNPRGFWFIHSLSASTVFPEPSSEPHSCSNYKSECHALSHRVIVAVYSILSDGAYYLEKVDVSD